MWSCIAAAGPGLGDIRAADKRGESNRHDHVAHTFATAVRALSSDARR